MAKELTQEEVLDFLCQGGGKVANALLLGHFKHFLRDPQTPAEQLQKHRDRFKRYVNSVAVVKPEGAVKYVVLRSRYRDLLGEDWRAAASVEEERQDEPEYNNRNDDQILSGVLHGPQVGGGWSSQTGGRQLHGNGYGQHRGEPVPGDTVQHQDTEVTSRDETFHGKSHVHSYAEPNSHDREIRLQHSSQLPSSARTPVPTDKDSTSSSPPSSKTSSPVNNPCLPIRNTYAHGNNEAFHTSSRTLLQQPSTTPLSSTRTSPSLSNTSFPSKTSPSHSNASMLSTKTSPSHSNVSMPSTKTSASPSNAPMPSTKTSEPPSNTSSPGSKDLSLANNLSEGYSKESSFCSSMESTLLPELHSPGGNEHWRHPTTEGSITETANPALLSAPRGELQEQKQGHTASTQLQTTNLHFNGTFHSEVNSEQEENSNYLHEQKDSYKEPTACRPLSRYIHCAHPSSSLLPYESNITAPDVLQADYQPTSPSPSPPLPLNDMHGMWMYEMPVFKSIRCQLSLQEMEDFVDQESCGSEGSDSGEGGDCDTEHREDEEPSSDSNTEKYAQYIENRCENARRCPPNRKFLSIIEQYDKLQSGDLLEAKETLVEREVESGVQDEKKPSPYVAKSFLTDQAPILFELARQPPKHRASSRFQELMSSSDDELIDRDYRKRRRPSRTKRPNLFLGPPQPDVDMLFTVKPVRDNPFIVNNLADQNVSRAQPAPNAAVDYVLKKFNYKQSAVPLDPMEHDWIVKSASGSWLHVYGLFNEDPQLALRKDFISGYTALHWFAKHGAIDMFFTFVAGAKKAGIELDLNIKSNGGYTPLHIAAIHGHHRVAAMLVEKLKVNVKLRDNSGKRAWQYLSCNTSGEVWQLLGAPKGKTIFASRALNTAYGLNSQNKSSQINRKTSLAAFLKPQHQKWKANNHPVLREREIYSD
ncbi:ankyrin repeat domain-containing protein SOWAHB [Hyperolius riggenbachi]|uniref:ankyrin repeat domain-containing protein SOWAHB n=1 Tax=Hyperolius riggenbachi TaxID=752182 RepID=UPI0035A2A607